MKEVAIFSNIVEEVRFENYILKTQLYHMKNIVNNFEYQKIKNNKVKVLSVLQIYYIHTKRTEM